MSALIWVIIDFEVRELKILILSDSHKNTAYMKQVIEQLKNNIAMIIHLGDVYDDIKLLTPFYQSMEFCCVLGNCDYGTAEPYDKTVTVGGLKLFLTHGHRYNVKYDDNRILYAAQEREADICMFGHTHIPALFREGKTLFINPGSISIPRNGTPSYAVLDISDDGKSSASVVGKTLVGHKILLSI